MQFGRRLQFTAAVRYPPARLHLPLFLAITLPRTRPAPQRSLISNSRRIFCLYGAHGSIWDQIRNSKPTRLTRCVQYRDGFDGHPPITTSFAVAQDRAHCIAGSRLIEVTQDSGYVHPIHTAVSETLRHQFQQGRTAVSLRVGDDFGVGPR